MAIQDAKSRKVREGGKNVVEDKKQLYMSMFHIS
jgi:hypothetical protein